MGRITRYPRKPSPRFVHEVQVGYTEVEQPWFLDLLARIAGQNRYKRRTPFWAFTIFSFVRKEQAEELELYLRRHREVREQQEARQWPCPVRLQYEKAARAQHAIIWGMSTGIMREVVRTYRRERADCTTHGLPNWIASDVILAAAPAIGRDRAREMVDSMLLWTIERYATWFWTGLQGDRIINRY